MAPVKAGNKNIINISILLIIRRAAALMSFDIIFCQQSNTNPPIEAATAIKTMVILAGLALK